MIAWEQKARIRYVDKLTKLKDKEKVPDYLDKDVWERWNAEWAKEGAKKKSKQNRKNRLGGPGGPSKHMGGYVSYATHSERLISIISRNISNLQYMYNF